MSRHTLTACLLVSALTIVLSPLAVAWTPYGYSPYGPGYQGGYSQAGPPETAAESPADQPQLQPPAYPGGGYGGPWGYGYGAEMQQSPYSEPRRNAPPAGQAYPGFGPPPFPSRGFPGASGPSFGRPTEFQISGETSEDAYTLTIKLDGEKPEAVQIRPQGQSLVIRRERTEQQERKDSFDDGRGFMRSFSYSSGTTRRRLSVPRDGDLSAMSREDTDDSILIRIPRRDR